LAQQFVKDRQKDKKHFSFFLIEMKIFIQNKLQSEQWSPEQINGYCKANGIAMVSHEWIYQYVYNDLKEGGQLYTQLRTGHKHWRKVFIYLFFSFSFTIHHKYINGINQLLYVGQIS